MKIAIVLPPGYTFCAVEPNSIETVIRTLSVGSTDEIRVFCETGAKARDDIPVTEIDPGGNRLVRRKRMIGAVKAFAPDYVEFHQHAISASAIAGALKAIPNSLYRHNYVKKPKHLIDRWRNVWRNRSFDSFIFVSEAAKANFLGNYPQYAGRTYAVANPIDASLWPGDPLAKGKTIIFSGRAAPEKGLAPLCDALTEVLPRHPDWKAVLVLNRFGVHGDWAQAQIDKLPATQLTVLKDQPLDAVKAQMKSAAVAVVPSIWEEPFGLVALEAHAAGCAVVSSGTGGLREASSDHALYVAEVTGSALSEALERLIGDDELRVTLAQSGQAFVVDVHTREHRAIQLHQVRMGIARV
ncbi:glycosyl transferase group 1 family protein [Asticcacaulis biprosthecium C19]|uniref:Glycosyl transferase group 1 family protein n=1 Tax=Asticcacaulis biprosthecium C19 TaxID=715226 RepID=F4QQ70_9CAUL|nr:glycosyltransferase family 4 protein [Asticcacaulis biprosthecium]EGF90357.1 glycosyl transferase group 1 family protein [Asticcacaulis biprosthecium C19]